MTSTSDDWSKYAEDPRTTEQLIQIAIEDWDVEFGMGNWPSATAILCARGDQATFEHVKALCFSSKPRERAVGAYMLGQFGLPVRTFPADCIGLLLKMLSDESDVEVLNSICTAFHGHILDASTVEAIARFKSHPSEDVRFGVAQGLLFCREETAVAILVELSRDSDDDVRDWATFGIGQIIDGATNPEQFDTPQIRQALFDRLDDPHWETTFEALAGLALRRDVRIVDRIVKMLIEDNPMAQHELCDALNEMREHFTGSKEMLELALSRCKEEDTE